MEHIQRFDFIGLILIIGGVSCLLVGFTLGQDHQWSAPSTITLLVVAIVMLICGMVNEFYTKKNPIIPPRIFKTRTTSIFLFSSFLHAVGFFAATIYLPLYFQVQGSSALRSGIEMLPYSLTASVTAVLSGQVIAKTLRYRPTLWVGWAVTVIGSGLMITLDEKSNEAKRILYLLVAAGGVGCLFQTPVIGMQAAMPLKDMATSTAALGLIRQIGGTIGISAGQAIIISDLRRRLTPIQNYGGDDVPDGDLINNVHGLTQIQPPDVRDAVIHQYTKSIATVWLVCTPLFALGLLSVLAVREYSMRRNVQRTSKVTNAAEDEKRHDLEAPASPITDNDHSVNEERRTTTDV
ncbi:hypothetical protein FRC02_005192 [Tulasnella sp. 418]|nr:hypothetical protein FRC02_005192 [Tulasnella sp. 418]